MIEGGSAGTEKGEERMVVYSSGLMSEVRIRDVRPAVKASGGKVGRLKSFRGIWAARAWDGGTGACASREAVLVAR